MTMVEMRVHMDCPGCERKIKKALSKLDGVDSIDIDMTMQKVTVMGWADQDEVLRAVRKTGRTAEIWPFPYNADYNDYYAHCYGSPTKNLNSDNSSYYRQESHLGVKTQSKYNYREDGYNGHKHGHYQQQPPYPGILDERATTMFSDDNATGCSIM